MLFYRVFSLVCFLVLIARSKSKSPPEMKKIPYTYPKEDVMGMTITDNFYYLGEYSKDNVETLKGYTKDENDWAEKHDYDSKLTDVTSDDIETFVKPFFESENDLGGRIGDYFYSRTTGDFNIWKRESLIDKKVTVILDENEVWKQVETPKYFHLDRVVPSPNGSYVAYSVDVVGNENYSVYIKNLGTGKIVGGLLQNCNKGFVWSLDEKFLLYEKIDVNPKQAVAIYSHDINDQQREDVEVLHVKNSTYEFSLGLTSDTNYITVTKKNYRDGCEVFYLERSQYNDNNVEFLPFKITDFTEGAEYFVNHGPMGWIVRYQKSGSLSNFGLYEATPNGEEFNLGKTYLFENGERYLMRADCFTRYVYVQYYDTKRMNCYVMKLDSEAAEPWKSLLIIPFGDFLGPHRGLDFFFGDWYPILGTNLGQWMEKYGTTDDYQVIVQSLRSPPILMIYNAIKGTRDIVKPARTVDGYNPNYYRDLFIETNNGPVNYTGFGSRNISTAVYWVGKDRKDVGKKKNRNWPLKKQGRAIILSVDSVYGKIVQPRFNPWMVPLMERGFLYGIVHARGSRNRGTYWHRMAQFDRLLTSSDIKYAIYNLMDQKWIKDGHDVILHGKGAGAIGVVNLMILYRDMYNLTLLECPYVSVLSKLLKEEEGALDRTEFGDVLNDEVKLQFWVKYDPYFEFTTKKANYPNVYIWGGVNDANYWGNGAKWMAQLRWWALQNDNTYVMRYLDNAGYLGPSPKFENKKATMTEIHSFVVKLVQGYVWHDPLEWLWILLCIMVLACWMVCFMALFICCELRSKKREKKRKEKEEEEKAGEAHVEGEGEDGTGEKENFGTFTSVDEENADGIGVEDGITSYPDEDEEDVGVEDRLGMAYADIPVEEPPMGPDDNLIETEEGDGLPQPIPSYDDHKDD